MKKHARYVIDAVLILLAVIGGTSALAAAVYLAIVTWDFRIFAVGLNMGAMCAAALNVLGILKFLRRLR